MLFSFLFIADVDEVLKNRIPEQKHFFDTWWVECLEPWLDCQRMRRDRWQTSWSTLRMFGSGNNRQTFCGSYSFACWASRLSSICPLCRVGAEVEGARFCLLRAGKARPYSIWVVRCAHGHVTSPVRVLAVCCMQRTEHEWVTKVGCRWFLPCDALNSKLTDGPWPACSCACWSWFL
jgi:hypothetical protein